MFCSKPGVTDLEQQDLLLNGTDVKMPKVTVRLFGEHSQIYFHICPIYLYTLFISDRFSLCDKQEEKMYIEFVKANSFKGSHRGRLATPLYFLFVSYRRLKQSLLAIVNTL